MHSIDDAQFVSRFDHLVEKVANDLVAVGGDADLLASLHQRTNHARASVRLAGAWRPLDREHAALECGAIRMRRQESVSSGFFSAARQRAALRIRRSRAA